MSIEIISAASFNEEPLKSHLILSLILKNLVSFDENKINKLNESKEKNISYVVEIVEEVLSKSEELNYFLSKRNESMYIYNGAFWASLDSVEIEKFLTLAALKLNINKYVAKYYKFVQDLRKQLLSRAYNQRPSCEKNYIHINLLNGTFSINAEGGSLGDFEPEHFLTYQLPFKYDNNESCDLFHEFLDKVLPDKGLQNILAEYIAYVFIRPKTLKLEKCLVLFGKGANGKSVFFEIINALLGSENISSFNLKSLTNESGYQRACLGNKLLNYSSEISNKMDSTYFKQLVSGEPVEARLLYGDPFIIKEYAKFIFNANELPKEVEQNDAFFRRFIIVKFDVRIEEKDRDPELASKIISKELPGVFNWVLDGLDRLLEQKGFSESEAVNEAICEYKKNSDTVSLFLEDNQYEQSLEEIISLKEFYALYNKYSKDSGYKPFSKRSFSDRLKNLGYELSKKNFGMVVFAKNIVS